MEDSVLVERQWRAGVRRAGDDAGLTIVELLIALFIVMLAFAALASTVLASFASIRNNEARVRGTALANELIEEMAAIPYLSLGLSEDDEAIDAGDPTFEGELLVMLPDDVALIPVDQNIERDGRVYEVERWVTWYEEGGSPTIIKRMVAVVTWEIAGHERTIRTEGLRAPDPQDLDLEVEFTKLENADDHGSYVGLNSSFENNQPIDVEILVGEAEASVEFTYQNRAGTLRIVTLPAAPGGSVQRSHTIAATGDTFVHGPVSFTVTATGTDGQLASHTGVLRFFQALEFLVVTGFTEPVIVMQDGSQLGPSNPLMVGCDNLPTGEVTIDASVAGLTPAEAIAGELNVQWGTLDGSDLIGAQPDPPLNMSDTAATAYGGEYRATVPDLTEFTPPDALVFRVTAERVVEEDPFHPYSAGPIEEDSVEVPVEQIGGCP